MTAVASRDVDRARRFAAEYEIETAYGSYEQLLADPNIDAIINPLPNALHCEWTIRAAEAGKHILCEKPLAVTQEQAARMAQAAATHGVLLMEAFTHRFTEAMQSVRRIVASGEIGEPVTAHCELTYTLDNWDNSSRASTALGGGALMDCGCYCVSALRFVLDDEPTRVQAVQRMRSPQGVDSTCSAVMVFQRGTTATFTAGMDAPFRCPIEVTGVDGRVLLPNFFQAEQVIVHTRSGQRTQTFEKRDRFAAQLDHFSQCILRREPTRFPPEDAVRNTRVLVALQHSATNGPTHV